MSEPDGGTETFDDGADVVAAIEAGRRRFVGVVFRDCNLSSVVWTGVSVEGGRLDHCVFSAETKRVHVSQARFIGVTFKWCDFRRCALDACAFRESTFEWCDFHRAKFSDGTTFGDAHFLSCSLSGVDPTGSDLALANLRHGRRVNGIAQLSPDDFGPFHEGFGYVDAAQQAVYVSKHRKDAIAILRTLGGHFLARGNFVDEGEVYYLRRSLELEELRHRGVQAMGPAGLVDVAGLWLAKMTCGFGERLGRVVATIGVVVAVVAVVLLVTDGVETETGEAAAPDGVLLTAVLQVAGRSPERVHPANNWIELLLGVETFVVLGLVGLFGFILANRIRSR